MRLPLLAVLLVPLVACGGGGSGAIAGGEASLFPSVRLASLLLRAPIDDQEIAWRATHNDLVIGRVRPDTMRPLNPHVRSFEYLMIRYLVLENQAQAFADAQGLDAEDFYLHFREDVAHPYFPSTVLVPGFAPGMIPGWNPAWEQGDPPASATSRSQSRVIGIANAVWKLANFSDPGYRAFLKDWSVRLLGGSAWGGPAFASGPAEGAMVDEALYYAQFGEGMLDRSAEYHGIPMTADHPHGAAIVSFHAELLGHLQAEVRPDAATLPNYGHTMFLGMTDPVSQGVQAAAGAAYGEVWIADRGGDGPTSGANRVISYEDDYSGIARLVRQSRAGGTRVLGAFDLAGGIAGTDRGRIYTLSLYCLLHGSNTYFAYETLDHLSDPSPRIETRQWNPVVTVDIGTPASNPPGVADFDGQTGTSEHYLFASGPDPALPSLTYRVFARRFTRGLVLARMLPEGSTVGDASATTHALGGSYRRVNGDGSLGPVVTEVALRNNEGAILVEP